MANALVEFSIKRSFFDRQRVLARLSEASHKVLFKFGANVRQTARRIQKKRGLARGMKTGSDKGYKAWQRQVDNQPPSTAPNPPNVHSPDENVSLRKVLYGYIENPTSEGVLVGAVLLNGGKKLGQTVPELHEHGGSRRLTDPERKRLAARAKKLFKMGRDTKGRYIKRDATFQGIGSIKRIAKYPKRPFMQPALDKHLPKLDRMWKNAMDKVR